MAYSHIFMKCIGFRGASWDGPLFFLCPFCPSRLSCRPDGQAQADRQRGEKLPHEMLHMAFFFVTLCDLRYVLLIFCIINLLNYFFSIFLMFRGPSWDAPLLFFVPVTLSHPVLPLSRTDARKRREEKTHGTIANDIIFCNFVLV